MTELPPPWKKCPDMPLGSIGWRMGDGEAYVDRWRQWAGEVGEERLTAYFKSHAPLPFEWMDWVAYELGFRPSADGESIEEHRFEAARWLETKQLATFSDYAEWYRRHFGAAEGSQ